ncbi:hypothetical protein QJR26_03340 [Clostridium baratii]
MDKLKQCPRCKNEELKGTENYCPICGLDLKVTAQEVKVQEQLEEVNFLLNTAIFSLNEAQKTINFQSFELVEYLIKSRLSKEEADKILSIIAKSLKQRQESMKKVERQPTLSKEGLNKCSNR